METTSAKADKGGKKQKGDRVRVRLPGDDSEILDAAKATGQALEGRYVFFRRGEAVVFPDPKGEAKMLPMDDIIFRSEIEKYVSFFKTRYDEESDVWYEVSRSLNTSDSKTILHAPEFWKTLPEIKRVHPCPLPARKPDGSIVILQKGFDPDTGIYTF